MVPAFVHLSNVWGDTNDALGWRQGFWQGVSEALHDGADGFVVDSTAEGVFRARSTWGDSPSISVELLDHMDWQNTRISKVVVDCTGASPRALKHLDQRLRGFGFRRAGRAWGEAGQTRLYIRPRDIRTSVAVAAAESKVRLGAAVVHVRDVWLSRHRFSAWRTKVALLFSGSSTPADVLDDDFGNTETAKPYINIRELLPKGFGLDRPSWGVNVQHSADPWDVAVRCHAQHGIWPISFSYPSEPLGIAPNPELLFSQVIPGFPYSFHDEPSYLAAYHEAYLGLTHRKAGWDCFRHVEIMAAGAIPFMPDIAEAPEFCMIHYPKEAMHQVVAQTESSGGPPDQHTRRAFRQYFNKHLSSKAMAEYLLRASNLQDAENILFVDAALGNAADYQSVLTLIGLKQLRGMNCDALHPVDYVYRDTKRDVQALYGRGFGYTKVLDGSLRSKRESGSHIPDLSDYDVIVVGSISRNRDEARALRNVFPAEQTIWIHGEDTPPSIHETHELRTSGAHVFVRAIHTRMR